MTLVAVASVSPDKSIEVNAVPVAEAAVIVTETIPAFASEVIFSTFVMRVRISVPAIVVAVDSLSSSPVPVLPSIKSIAALPVTAWAPEFDS